MYALPDALPPTQSTLTLMLSPVVSAHEIW
jgi:hypothetical protein